MRCAIVVVVLLAAACGSATATPPVLPHVAQAHAHVSRETAEHYARSLAKAAWTDLRRLPKEQAVANIWSQLRAFSDITGCAITASRRGRYSPAEHPGYISAVYRNVIAAVKCP